MRLDPHFCCAFLEAEAAVVEVPLHGGPGLRHRVSTDGIEDLLVLSLKCVDLPAIGERCLLFAPWPPRYYEAAKIFQYPLKLRITSGFGDFAMKREIFIDSVPTFRHGRMNCDEMPADLLNLGRRGALGGQPCRLDLDTGT